MHNVSTLTHSGGVVMYYLYDMSKHEEMTAGVKMFAEERCSKYNQRSLVAFNEEENK